MSAPLLHSKGASAEQITAPPRKGKRLGVITRSGGGGALIMALREHGPQEVFRLLPLFTRCIALWSLLAFFLVDVPVFAAGFYWSGASAPDLLWTTLGNWDGAVVPGPTDAGTFTLGTPTTVYLNGNTSLLPFISTAPPLCWGLF